jgi:uncharacterized protein YdcH (DUF465 family)
MSEFSEEVRKVLGDQSEEFRRWVAKHNEYESRLAELAGKPSLTLEEELEEKHLKKQKLFLKDQIAAKIRHVPVIGSA